MTKSNEFKRHTSHTLTRAVFAFKENGDSLAAKTIFEKMEDRVFRFARKIAFGNKLKSEIPDLVAVTFSKLFEQLRRKPDSIYDKKSLWSVLARLCRHSKEDFRRAGDAQKRGGAGRDQYPTVKQLTSHGIIPEEKRNLIEKELSGWIAAREKAVSAKERWLVTRQILTRNQMISDEELDRFEMSLDKLHGFDEFPVDELAIENQSSSSVCVSDELEIDQFAMDVVKSIQNVIEQSGEEDSPLLLKIIILHLDGKSKSAIAKELGLLHHEQVSRKFNRIKKMLLKDTDFLSQTDQNAN